MYQKKIEISKLNDWWNKLSLFSKKELYKYWEG